MVSSTATDGAAKVYTCPTCARQFNKKANLKVHSRKHTGEKPYACSRPGCDRRFMWKSSVSFHEQNCVVGAPGSNGNGHGNGNSNGNGNRRRDGASSVPKRHKMMMTSTASAAASMANMAAMNMSHHNGNIPMSMSMSMSMHNDASSLLSIIPTTPLESPPRPHVTNVVQMPVDYGMQQQHHHQQQGGNDFLRNAMQSGSSLAQQQLLFQQQQQQQHHAMAMAAASSTRQANPFPLSMLPTTTGSHSTFPTPTNNMGGLRMDSANNINNNFSSTSNASAANTPTANINMSGTVSSQQQPSAMFSHISHLDASTRPLHPVGPAGSTLPVHTTPTLPPSFPSESNPLPAPSTILKTDHPAAVSLHSANRPPLFLGKPAPADSATAAKPPKGMKMPIAMELDESDDEGTTADRIIGAQETFMRTGNIFTFAPPPRCSPLPASSPIVGHGISAMPLSPLAPFSPLPPDSPAHNAPNPVHPPLNQPPRSANTNF